LWVPAGVGGPSVVVIESLCCHWLLVAAMAWSPT
jgi:hypothetical protein